MSPEAREQMIEMVARGIAEKGFGRSWDDFLPCTAFDTDQNDLLEYAAAALDALLSSPVMMDLVRNQEVGRSGSDEPSGLRPCGAEPPAESQAEPLVPNAEWVARICDATGWKGVAASARKTGRIGDDAARLLEIVEGIQHDTGRGAPEARAELLASTTALEEVANVLAGRGLPSFASLLKKQVARNREVL